MSARSAERSAAERALSASTKINPRSINHIKKSGAFILQKHISEIYVQVRSERSTEFEKDITLYGSLLRLAKQQWGNPEN